MTETPEPGRERTGSGREGLVVASTYRVLGQLGAGSMGEVFEAEHVRLGNRVAVKFLRDGSLADPRAVLRFRSEARALAGLQSEHVVRVFDCGELPDGVPYLVMERLFGEDLRSLLARTGVLSLPRTLRLITDACQGLVAVHGAGVVHRDLKPANLFVTRRTGTSETCKILDFGVAKTVASDSTQQGHLLGTLRYMAPEQIEDSSSATASTDIYALAAILYECLTGAPVHAGSSFQQTMLSILNASPRAISEFRSVPPELDRLVLRALSKDPQDRPATAKELIRALRAFARVAAADGTATLADESLDGVVGPTERPRRSRALYAALSLVTTFGLGLAMGPAVKRVFVRTDPEQARVAAALPAPTRAEPALAVPSASAPSLPPPAAPASARDELPTTRLPSLRAASAERKPLPRVASTAGESVLSERFDVTNPYAD